MNIGLTFEHYSSKRSHIEKIKRGDYNKVNQGRREKKNGSGFSNRFRCDFWKSNR